MVDQSGPSDQLNKSNRNGQGQSEIDQTMNGKESSKLALGAYIDWKREKPVKRLFNRIKNITNNYLRTTCSINKLNSFFVLIAKFNHIPQYEERIELESKIREELNHYTDQISKGYKQELIDRGDLSNIYVAALKENNYKILGLTLKKQFYKSNELISIALDKLISNASVFIWDLPGIEKDRVLIRGQEFEFEQQQKDLISIIDELLISVFALYFVPYSNIQLVDLVNELESCISEFDKIDETGRFPESLEFLTENFIGSLSSLQESIKLFSREISLVNQYAKDTKEVLATVTSPELRLWAKNQLFAGENTISKLNHLTELIDELKPKLRTIKTGDDQLSRKIVSSLLDTYVNIFPRSINIAHWVSLFQDIPSYTAIEDGIGFEEVSEERYKPSDGYLLEGKRLFKLYKRGQHTIYALRGIDITIEEGEFVVIRGPSGAGKTTLLNLLSGLDFPNRGTVFYENNEINTMNSKQRSKWRSQNISFIFQNYALIPHLSAYENAKLPLDFGDFPKEYKKDVNLLLEDVGIAEFSDHKPALLSGGQMQRLSIVRALVKRPTILFADEPTGDLDQKTGANIMNLFKRYHQEYGLTIILITHDPEVSKYADREIFLQDGKIVPELDQAMSFH